ncbi:uncharacterized protein Bfra_004551 [Botrytis fragariae]|uniref:Uncharacterized protein n=1 Tax=Botrytis fragariae TaxID=1964551 RepID=A0A8H6AW61_9HELO|nr:uncharacterized protein Bfra_004551 [Botrytis fragariae]KAF5874540.1 hypothetical protein Bfra_004551 [Botrytis fragariae]
MGRSTNITAAIASAVAQATGFTLFIYFSPLNPLHNSPSSSLTDKELLWHQGRHQFWAILFFSFTFSMSFMSFALRIRDELGDRSKHEDALKAKTKETTEEKSKTTKVTKSTSSTKLTKVESETHDTKEARSTKIEQSSEEVRETDEPSNFDEHVKTRVELVNTKTALKKEQERVNRIEQVMESLQAQVGVLRARLTVQDAEAKNKRKRVQTMEEDGQRQADILATRIMTQEAKMEEVLERLDENDSSHDAIGVWIEKLTREGKEIKEELERFDGVDEEISEVYHILRKEVSKIQETAKDNLEELRADALTVEQYWTEEFQRIDDNRQSREWDFKEEIKIELKKELKREQEMREIDEWWEKRLGQGEITEEELIASQEAEDEMEVGVTNTASRLERSSQTEVEPIETRVDEEVEGDMGGHKKQETHTSAEIETPIQEKNHPLSKAVEYATQNSLDQERNAEMKDIEQGKDEGMEDITHELEDAAEVEGKDSDLDKEWTEL